MNKPILVFFASLLIFFSCVTPSIVVTNEQKMGDYSFNQHDYPEAIKHYNLMLESSRKLGVYRNLSMESDVNRKIANCHEMMGNYEQALYNVDEALKLDSADNNLLGKVEDYRQEGRILAYAGSYHKGIKCIEKSLLLSENLEQSIKNVNRLTVAENYLALAQLYSTIGKAEIALEFAGKALNSFRQAEEKTGEMESLIVLGSVFADLGDNAAGRTLIEQSIKKADELDLGKGRQYQLLAVFSASEGKYEDALRAQEKAIEESGKSKIVGQMIWSVIGMGDIYREIGDSKKAAFYYRMAGRIRDTTKFEAASHQASLDLRLGNLSMADKFFRAEGSLTGQAISSLRLAELYIQNQLTDSAFLFLDRSGGMFRLSSNRQGIANVQLLEGRLLIETGKYTTAKQLLDSALKAEDFPETVWQSWFHIGRLHELTGNDKDAITAYRNSISVIEKIRGNFTIDEFKSLYFDSKRDVYDRLIHLLLKDKDYFESFRVSEQSRARAFFDIISNRKINFRDVADGELIAQEQEKRIELQKLFKLIQKNQSESSLNDGVRSVEIRQLRSNLAALQVEYEDILQRIKLNNPSYADLVSAKTADASEIQASIDLKTSLLEYWIRDDEIIIWVITPTDVFSGSIKTDKEELNSLIEETRNNIRSNSASMAANLNRLYRLLISPVEKQIKNSEKLIIVPNQGLHLLPFQALIDDTGNYLIQNYHIMYAPSASVFLTCSKRPVRQGTSFMGMALGDVSIGAFSGLPETENELKKIVPVFPENITSFGKESTEAFLRKNAGRYNILHFATHGSYNYKQPLYSFLLFYPDESDDGHLNVYEIFEMNLNASLVTLSACETGLGNITQGDEMTGLSRAFLFAGSSAVIVSLWSVADYPTALLMANFCRHLKDHSLQEALTLAQREIIKIYPQPLYWSPFILVGNGNLTTN